MVCWSPSVFMESAVASTLGDVKRTGSESEPVAEVHGEDGLASACAFDRDRGCNRRLSRATLAGNEYEFG